MNDPSISDDLPLEPCLASSKVQATHRGSAEELDRPMLTSPRLRRPVRT